jgi:hypothetical protein
MRARGEGHPCLVRERPEADSGTEYVFRTLVPNSGVLYIYILVYKKYFWVSYFRSLFLWSEIKKFVISLMRIYLIASLFICALCILTSDISQTSPDIHP